MDILRCHGAVFGGVFVQDMSTSNADSNAEIPENATKVRDNDRPLNACGPVADDTNTEPYRHRYRIPGPKFLQKLKRS